MAVIFGPSLWQYLACNPLGGAVEGDPVPFGGYLICRNGGIAWVVAPSSSEVSRTWYNRDDAVTTATACTNATGWFVPTITQLQNPGYTCRNYWDTYSTSYWSSTDGTIDNAWYMVFTPALSGFRNKGAPTCVRAFRCIAY